MYYHNFTLDLYNYCDLAVTQQLPLKAILGCQEVKRQLYMDSDTGM